VHLHLSAAFLLAVVHSMEQRAADQEASTKGMRALQDGQSDVVMGQTKVTSGQTTNVLQDTLAVKEYKETIGDKLFGDILEKTVESGIRCQLMKKKTIADNLFGDILDMNIQRGITCQLMNNKNLVYWVAKRTYTIAAGHHETTSSFKVLPFAIGERTYTLTDLTDPQNGPIMKNVCRMLRTPSS